jgi:hypothetical protein
MFEGLVLRFYDSRLEKLITFGDLMAFSYQDPKAIPNMMAAQLWDENAKDWVEFEKAKEIIYEMPLELISKLAKDFYNDIGVANLFYKKQP